MDRILIEKVQNLRNEGKSFGEISKELLITKSNASYCSKIDLNKYDAKMAARDKYIDTVCALAKKCSNINQILKILGKKSTNEYYKQIKKILEENNVDTSHFTYNEKYKPNGIEEKKSLSDYLVIGSAITISKLRSRLIKEGVKEHKCEKCGRTEWEGEIIPLQLHHINGDRTDNRLENLQLLCPNCHALTDNYCGRKLKVKKEKTKIVRASKMVSKEELINDFRVLGSFKAVGSKHNVSDKTIVKWCEKHLLPTNAKEMRNYIRSIFGDIKWRFSNGNSKTLREYQKKKFRTLDRIGETGEIEKRYTSVKELLDDGFDPKNVYRVCRGELKTHHKKVFKYV